MAINVYMTLFRKYNAQQLKALEWRYHCMVCVLWSNLFILTTTLRVAQWAPGAKDS